MKQIPILGTGTSSRSKNATAQTLVNMFVEQGDDKALTIYGRPGLTLFANLGDEPIRGMYAIDDTVIYVVHRNKFYEVNNAGVATEKGTMTSSSGRVDMSHNTTQIIVVDGSTTGYIYTIASGVLAAIADADYPGADTVAFNNGRFIANKPDTGQYWISGSYAGTSWGGADFATAESSPDNLVRVVVDHDEVILLGERTTEFAIDTGGLDFPYTRVSGATAEWGLAARWSVAKFGDSLIWLAKNRLGEVQVTKLAGYQLQKASTNDIDSIFNSYATVADATGLSYLYNGHPFYHINFPSVYKSWLYDGLSDKWSELRYSESNMFLAEIAVPFNGTTKVSSWINGHIYTVDGDVYTDNGEPIYCEITGKHVQNGLEKMSISALQVDCEAGATTDPTLDPQIMLQISKDGGNTWGVERWVDLGQVGEYRKRAIWHRLGMARDWVFRFRITDNIKKVITGVWIK